MKVARLPRLTAIATASALAFGCMVGPNYRRPDVTTPGSYRGVEAAAEEASLADVPWWDVFRDPVLEALIQEALAKNLDLQVAAARVLEARAQAGIARSFLFPEVGAAAGYGAEQVSRLSDPPQGADDKTYQNWNFGVNVSWELDLFGRIRREREAAVARYLATEEGRRAVLVTLIGDVADSYFRLLELDLEIEIARRTLLLNDETIEFYRTRLEGGVSNRLEVDQAVANRAITAATIPEIERQIAITENGLSVLLGRPPGPIERGVALSDQYLAPEIPAGIPATLLERRPDVVSAEHQLMAANADVGAARALFYPSIGLTGAFGGLSGSASDLLKSDSILWSVGAGLFQPLFQGGRIRRNVEAYEARYVQAVAEYQKAALNAYRDVADALVTRRKLAEVRVEQETGVEALRDASQLARSRYDNGLSNYLEVLIADQALFQQELLLARTRGAELQAFAQIYRSLGGGWQFEGQAAAPAVAEPVE